AANARKHFWALRALYDGFDAFDELVTGVDVDARIAVGEAGAFFHGNLIVSVAVRHWCVWYCTYRQAPLRARFKHLSMRAPAKHRASGFLICIALLLWGILPVSAWGARAVRVYEVDVSGQSTTALQEAMRQALVRATGRRESANDPALASLVEDAPKYVKSYSPGPRGETQVIFDRTAVERGIVAAGRSVWDPERPFTLVVLYPPPSRADADAARSSLEQAAAARGLLISVIPLSIVDANGTELGREALLNTAQRFGGDEVLVGRSDTGAPAGQYQWTLNTRFSSQSWSGPLSSGIDGTVDILAPAQGASLAQTEAKVLVQVEGVATLTDYANVERMLESVPGVRGANIVRAGGNAVTFDITARGGSEALDHALSGSSRLVRSGTGMPLVYQYHP